MIGHDIWQRPIVGETHVERHGGFGVKNGEMMPAGKDGLDVNAGLIMFTLC